MNNFTFHDGLSVVFGENTFGIVDDGDLIAKATAVNDKLQDAVKQNPNDTKYMLNAFLDAIDSLLGDGSTAKIFEGHSLNAQNIIGAYMYIVNAIYDSQAALGGMMDEMADKFKAAEEAPVTAIPRL